MMQFLNGKTPIEVIGLGERTLRALYRADITTVEALTSSKWSKVRGIGESRFREIRLALDKYFNNPKI